MDRLEKTKVFCVVQVSREQPDEFSGGNLRLQSQRPPEARKGRTCAKRFLFQTLPKVQVRSASFPNRHHVTDEALCRSDLFAFILLDLRFDAFMDYSIPEILRVPLEELCLHIMVNKAHTHT